MGAPRGKRAPKMNRMHSEQSVMHIQAVAIINRLQNFALDWDDPATKKPVVMSDSQVRAALGLLHKRLANAEAPRDLRLKGEITLRRLIECSVTGEKPNEEDDG